MDYTKGVRNAISFTRPVFPDVRRRSVGSPGPHNRPGVPKHGPFGPASSSASYIRVASHRRSSAKSARPGFVCGIPVTRVLPDSPAVFSAIPAMYFRSWAKQWPNRSEIRVRSSFGFIPFPFNSFKNVRPVIPSDNVINPLVLPLSGRSFFDRFDYS